MNGAGRLAAHPVLLPRKPHVQAREPPAPTPTPAPLPTAPGRKFRAVF